MLRKLLALTLLFTTIPSAQAAPIYVFPVPNCEVNYARAHHDYPATDILAKAGCRFVAPTSGVVDEVNRVDTWRSPPNLGITRGGLSVSIIGDDGVRYYGSHLRSIPLSIEPGVVVKASVRASSFLNMAQSLTKVRSILECGAVEFCCDNHVRDCQSPDGDQGQPEELIRDVIARKASK